MLQLPMAIEIHIPRRGAWRKRDEAPYKEVVKEGHIIEAISDALLRSENSTELSLSEKNGEEMS